MERVKAGEEVQGFGHGSVAGDRFGEGEVTKPDGTVIYEFGADHFFVLDEIVFAHSVVFRGGLDFEGAGRGELLRGCASGGEVDVLKVP